MTFGISNFNVQVFIIEKVAMMNFNVQVFITEKVAFITV